MLQAKEEKSNIENQNPNLLEAMHDVSSPLLQHKHEQTSMDIIIRSPFVINLDDYIDIAKIDEQAHNELTSFFASSMSLNDNSPKNSVELSASSSLALVVVPLASCSPFTYIKQDWDVDNLL